MYEKGINKTPNKSMETTVVRRVLPEDASRSRALIIACEMHSKRSSGFMFGRQRVSHMPAKKHKIGMKIKKID